MSSLFDKGDDNQTVTQVAQIPAFLQPFLSRAAGTGSSALTQLSRLINAPGASTVSPFNQNQIQAFDLAARRAMGESGFFPAAQNQLLDTAMGRPVDSFIPEGALTGLSGFGSGLESFLPQASLATLMRGATTSGVPVSAMDAAGNLLDAELIPGVSRDALSRTASGEFLFGGEGFDQAVDAAVRAARPGILSTFRGAGVGGGTGALANAAIGRSAVDAFANQFAQERQNQLSAASQLGNLGLAGGQQRLSAAGLLGDLGLSGTAQQLGAASSLAGLSDQERQRQLQAGSTQAGLLGGLADSERSRALQAAFGLPGLATADIDLLSRIGAMQQGQAQQELTAPIDMQRMLLQLAMGAPLGGTIGSSTTTPVQSNALGNILGGASTGFGMFGPIGGIGGGLLGLLGSL